MIVVEQQALTPDAREGSGEAAGSDRQPGGDIDLLRGARGLLASFEGELAAGNELARPAGRAHDEAFVFRLAGEAAPRFVFESRMLRRACVVATPEDEADSLRFYLGVTTVLQVNPL